MSIISDVSSLPSAHIYDRYEKQPKHGETLVRDAHSDVSTVVTSDDDDASYVSAAAYRKYGGQSRNFAEDLERRHSHVESVHSHRKSATSDVSSASTTHSDARYRKYNNQSKVFDANVERGHDDDQSVVLSRTSELSDVTERSNEDESVTSSDESRNVYTKYSRQSKTLDNRVVKQHSEVESAASSRATQTPNTLAAKSSSSWRKTSSATSWESDNEYRKHESRNESQLEYEEDTEKKHSARLSTVAECPVNSTPTKNVQS